jgi:predicted cobalt transporter CbtA
LSRRKIVRHVLVLAAIVGLVAGLVLLGLSPLWVFAAIGAAMVFSMARKGRTGGWRAALSWPPDTAPPAAKRLRLIAVAGSLAALGVLISDIPHADLIFWFLLAVSVYAGFRDRRVWKPPKSP